MYQDMVVSILPGGQPGSAWRQPHQQVALVIRLLIFAVGGLTAYAVSRCDQFTSFVTGSLRCCMCYGICLACFKQCCQCRNLFWCWCRCWDCIVTSDHRTISFLAWWLGASCIFLPAHQAQLLLYLPFTDLYYGCFVVCRHLQC